MEQAVFISKVKNLKYVTDRYSRLYFGVEFCQRLIPSLYDLEEILDFVSMQKLKFTFVTPYLTDENIRKLAFLMKILIDRQPDVEIVVNDWGLFYFLEQEYGDRKIALVLGRLLSKQRRDPRISAMKDKFSKGTLKHLRGAGVDADIFVNFLINRGIGRVELDNLCQGLSRRAPRISASLYLPFVYLTTTRLCFANLNRKEQRALRVIHSCDKECQKYTFKLRHRFMGRDLFLKGNTIVFENNKLPDNLNAIGVDRIVYEPEIPL